jgi:hypothetical protein
VNVQEALVGWNGIERSVLGTKNSSPAHKSSREDALKELVAYYAQNPGASYSMAGQIVNRSKAWVSEAMTDLEQSGRLRRNGHGIEIINEN